MSTNYSSFSEVYNIREEADHIKNEVIYSKVRELCSKKNVSVSSVEQSVGLSTGSISKWKIVSPSVNNLKRVADYFGVSIEYFLEE